MSVKFRILTSFALLISAIVLTVTIYSDANFRQSSRAGALHYLNLEATLISESLENKLLRYYQGLNLISETLAIDETGMPVTAQLSHQLIKLENNLNMFGAAYATDDGITYKPTGIIPDFNAKRLKREWFVRSMNAEKYVATLPYTNNKGELVMSLSVPVERLDRVVGVLNANISVDELSETARSKSEKAQFFVSREDGYLLASGDADHIGKSLSDLFPDLVRFNDAASSEVVSGQSYEVDEDERYAVTTRMEKLGWNILVWERWASINSDARENFYISMAIAVLLTLFALGITYYLVMRLLYAPVGGEPARIEALVSGIAQGKLIQDKSAYPKPEGILSGVLGMSLRLSESIGHIRQEADKLSATAAKISESASGQTKSSVTQTQELEHTSVAMNQMNLSVSEVAGNAVNAAHSADEAHQFSLNGIEMVSQMNHDMDMLMKGMEEVAAVTDALETESQSIGTILDVISTISEQTNLLALNAAIEAARAGEHGRGFAVVADEVRGLANRTKESTSHIRDLISELQEKAASSAVLMKQNARNTEVTASRSRLVNEALTDIQSSVSTIKDMNNQIATATEEQSVVAGDIHARVSEISQLAKSNAQSAEENQQLSDELKSICNAINRSLGHFS